MISRTFTTMTLVSAMHTALCFTTAGAWEPVRAHSLNPYILEFRDRPTLAATFAESYDSVRDQFREFIPYLNVLHRDGVNLTRVWLIGHPLDFPNSASHLINPWPRSTSGPNALDGLLKWDFSAWDENYFNRLKAFAQAASDRGIIVEFTFFSVLYSDDEWAESLCHPSNNVQGYGSSDNRYDSFRQSSANATLQPVLENAVRRIVRELNPFDNIYYEIQNEPFWNEPGVMDAEEAAFHNRMLAVIRDEESGLPNRHMVAHNFPQQIANLSTDFDILNEHYPAAVPGSTIAGCEALLSDYYNRGRILSFGESDTVNVPQIRLEAWMFFTGGGSIYNGKDAQFLVYSLDDPEGDTPLGADIRGTLRNTLTYMNQLHLVALRRDFSWILSGVPSDAKYQAMASSGQQYVAYFHHGQSSLQPFQVNYDPIDSSNHSAAPTVLLEAGSWRAVWTRPADLAEIATEEFDHPGGTRTLAAVSYQEDVALRIDRTNSGDLTPPPIPAELVITPGQSGSLEVSWNAVQAVDLASYRLYRSETPGFLTDAAHLVATLNAANTSFSDSSITPGITCYYAVTAVDNLGNESAASAETASAESPAIPSASFTGPPAGESGQVVQWSAAFPGWHLQESPDLSTGSWTDSTLPVSLVGEHYQVTLPSVGTQRFFRLAGPPPPP
jgi:hypothetical protein